MKVDEHIKCYRYRQHFSSFIKLTLCLMSLAFSETFPPISTHGMEIVLRSMATGAISRLPTGLVRNTVSSAILLDKCFCGYMGIIKTNFLGNSGNKLFSVNN